jgi:hypothetical protein
MTTEVTVSLRGSAIDPQAIVSMMLPSALLEVVEELEELELPLRSEIELSMNDEMSDCAAAALDEDVLPDVEPEALEVPAVRALIRFWKAVVRLEATLLEAPEPASMFPSSSLLVEAIARLVSAAAVDAAVAVEFAAEPEAPLALAAEVAAATVFCADAALEALNRLESAEAWLLPMLPIDIIIPIAASGIRGIGRP